MDKSAFQFDESVQKALEKWPNVPYCFGWISLNRRGQWLIKNHTITHNRALEFLARNYTHDEHGRWFVQNGPQRVFCNLECAPLIYSLNPDLTLTAHTGCDSGKLTEIILDDDGNLLINSDLGLGIVDDRDLLKFYDSVVAPAEETNWFDFDYVKNKNIATDVLEITFNGDTCSMIALPKNKLEEKYQFTCSPQPLEAEL